MNTIKKNLNIPSFETIMSKTVPELKVVDVIALTFYAFERVSEKDSGKDIRSYFMEFETDIKKQQDNGWPKLLVNRNDYKKRFDVFCTEPFVRSQNILVLLARLIYIEQSKKVSRNSLKQYSSPYNKVLSRKMETFDINVSQKITVEMSFPELLHLLELCIKYYTTVYYDELLLEYQLGTSIIKNLNN